MKNVIDSDKHFKRADKKSVGKTIAKKNSRCLTVSKMCHCTYFVFRFEKYFIIYVVIPAGNYIPNVQNFFSSYMGFETYFIP